MPAAINVWEERSAWLTVSEVRIHGLWLCHPEMCGPRNHNRREGEGCSPQGKQEGQERRLGPSISGGALVTQFLSHNYLFDILFPSNSTQCSEITWPSGDIEHSTASAAPLCHQWAGRRGFRLPMRWRGQLGGTCHTWEDLVCLVRRLMLCLKRASGGGERTGNRCCERWEPLQNSKRGSNMITFAF